MPIINLTRSGGQVVFVNTDHIVGFSISHEYEKLTSLSLVNGIQLVREKPEQIAALFKRATKESK